MKRNNFIFRLYSGILLVIFGLIVLHAPLTVWLGSQFPDHELLYKAWKEVLLILALPLGVWLALKAGLAKQMWHDKLFLAIAGFALLHVLLILAMPPSAKAAIAGLMIDLRYLLFFVLIYICIKLEPGYRRTFLQFGLAGAIIILGFALLQIFVLPNDVLAHIGYSKATISPYLTVDKNPNYIRINSTLRGPNPLGAYVVIWLSLVAACFIKINKRRLNPKLWLVIILSVASGLIVLWASYSRSALIGLLVSLGALLGMFVWRKSGARKWLARAAVLLIILVSFTYAMRGSSFIQEVVLHNNPHGGSRIDSTQAHADSLTNGAKKAINQPLGSGVGSTGSASLLGHQPLIVENQYLFTAHESGWLGLVLFLFIFIVILKRLWHQKNDWLSVGVLASGIGLAIVGLLLPVWADGTVSLIWWGLAAIALASAKGNYGRKSTKQKTA